MSCTGTANCVCGCCSGTSVQTPQLQTNLPGQSALVYRAGTWASFKQSMLARLSSSDYPALAGLKTRDDDDFTIAFLDATAVVLDILTFYQERLVNESYLGTATQLRSLIELSRLIGYQPSPGVAASVYLAFTLKAAPGQPMDPATPAITIPAGTQVQSVPAQNQTPQVFETSADIQAKVDWNALPVQTGQPWVAPGGNGIYLSGTSTQLQLGDSLLILGVDREEWAPFMEQLPTGAWFLLIFPSDQWDVVVINTIQVDNVRNLTYVAWDQRLQHESGLTSGTGWVAAKVYAFRQKAALFGHNAPSPNLFVSPQNATTAPLPSLPSLITPNPSHPLLTMAAGNEPPAGTYQVKVTYITATGETAPSAASSITTSGANLLIQVASPAPWVNATGWNVYFTSAGGSAFYQQNSTPNVIGIAYSQGGVINTAGGPPPTLPASWVWNNYSIVSSNQIYLDAIYPKITVGSWFALTNSGTAQLYKVTSAATASLFQYALSGKVTVLAADYPDYNISTEFPLQNTQVWAQSEELAVAYQPLDHPLYGGFLDLQGFRPDLVGVTVVAISGNRQKVEVADGVTTLSFVPDDQSSPVQLKPGDILTLTAPAPLPLNSDSSVPDWCSITIGLTLSVEDSNGRPGTIPQALLSNFELVLSTSSDPEVSEYALVKSVTGVTTPYPHTQVLLQSNLLNCYDRNSASVNANVALATAGRSVSEILGSGSASTPDQEFTLKQSPLTYVQAPTPTGRQSSLQVQVNGAAWTEAPSQYQQGPSAQVFATLNEPGGATDVLFGDGTEGATLPTGQNNVQANYRVGLGAAGNVAASAISTLIDRPLGVSAVTNPSAATGGEDPDSVDDIRTSAPQSVLTLGRAVSISDYQSYASTFAGIAKAYATWIPSGPARGVFLTVAGVNGAALPPGNPTLANLVVSLQNYGNPLVPVTAVTFLETLFGLSANVAYDPAYNQPTVQAAVLEALTENYSFANRTFGQGVSADEICAVIQAVPGVVAVNVTAIRPGPTSRAGDLAGEGTFSLSAFNSWLSQQVTGVPRPSSGSAVQICPYIPVAASQGLPLAAEILVLDPNPNNVILGVMP